MELKPTSNAGLSIEFGGVGDEERTSWASSPKALQGGVKTKAHALVDRRGLTLVLFSSRGPSGNPQHCQKFSIGSCEWPASRLWTGSMANRG